MPLTVGLDGFYLISVPPCYPPTGGCLFDKTMLASITSDYELFGTVSVTDSFSATKVPELYLSSSTICTEPEPNQHTSSTISTPSSPELPRACRSTLPSPRWSLSLELSPTGTHRKLNLGVAESDSKPNHSRRTQYSQDLKLRRVKSCPCGQRPSVVRIRRNQSEGCIAWQPCASTRSSGKNDGKVLNNSAQASQCSLIISTARSCLAPVSCSTVTKKVVKAVPTGTVINDAFSLGRTDDEAVPTTKTTETSRIALLMLRKKALVDELSRLHLELLHSLRAEWFLTRVFPEGFEEFQDYAIDPNPRLKSTSFPLVHLLQYSTLNRSHNRGQVECPESSDGQGSDTARTFEPSDCQGDLLIRKTSASSALTGLSSFKGSLQSFTSETTSQHRIGSAAGNTELMAQSMKYEPSISTTESHSSRTSNCSESGPATLSQLEQRLAGLEEDYAVVSQIYKVHRQRASETNWTAYRSAYKCNAQKLRELSKEIDRLRREIKIAVLTFQDPLQRSNSLSNSQTSTGFPADTSGAVAVATLPRRRPFRPPPCIRRNTMAQPRTGVNSWWTIKRRTGSRSALPTAPPSMFSSVCDGGPIALSVTTSVDETGQCDKPSNYDSLGRQKELQAPGRIRPSFLSLAFRWPPRTIPTNRSSTAQQSHQSSVDTLANTGHSRPPSESRVMSEPYAVNNEGKHKSNLRGSQWTTRRSPAVRLFSSSELLPLKRAGTGENCPLRRSRSYLDAGGWIYLKFFQSSHTDSSALMANKTLGHLDDGKYAFPVTDLLRTDFVDETNSASADQVRGEDQTLSHPTQLFVKSVFATASSSMRSSSGCYSFSSQNSSQLSSLALSTSCGGQGSTVKVRPETCAPTPLQLPPVEAPANEVVHLRRTARIRPARVAPAADTNASIKDNEDANSASCQAFCPAKHSIRCICSCISEVKTADAVRECSCLDITVPDRPLLEDLPSCSTMIPMPQRRPPPLLSEDEHSIDLQKLLKSEKGRSFTLPGGNSGSNRGIRKLENVIDVRRSFNPLNMFRLSIARGQSAENAITVVASAPVVKSATLTTSFDPKTPPMDSSVPVTKPRQSFWQRARQSFLPAAAANSQSQK